MIPQGSASHGMSPMWNADQTQTQTQSGGGILPILGDAAMIGLHFARRGGIIPLYTHANHNMPPETQRRAAGGVTTIPSSHGGPAVPQITISPNGGTSGGMSAVTSYLNNAANSAYTPAPTPTAAPSVPSMGSGNQSAPVGLLSSGLSDAQISQMYSNPAVQQQLTGAFLNSPVATINYNGQQITVPNNNYQAARVDTGGNGGGNARGGIVRRDAGGDLGGMQSPAQPSPPPPAQTGNDPWQELMDVGLGIMGQSSPQAGPNIGRGALEGLKIYQGQRESQANINARQSESELQNAEAGHTEYQTQHEKLVNQALESMNGARGTEGVPPISSGSASSGPAWGSENPDRFAATPTPPAKYMPLIQQAAQDNGVPLQVATWVIGHESGYNPTATGPKTKNGWQAQGIMQFSPDTAKSLGVDPMNPTQAIPAGLKYLRTLYDQTGSWDSAVQRYGTFSSGVSPQRDAALQEGFQRYTGRTMGPRANLASSEPTSPPSGQPYQVASNSPVGGSGAASSPQGEYKSATVCRSHVQCGRSRPAGTEIYEHSRSADDWDWSEVTANGNAVR